MVSTRPAVDRRTYSIEEYGEIYGISRTRAYRLAREDGLTVPVIRLGRRMLVSQEAVKADLARQKESGDEPAAA